MSFGVHPFVLIAMVAAIAALVAIVIACRAKSGLLTAVMILLALFLMIPGGAVFLVFHPEWIDARFRTYKNFYGEIKTGMTRDEVLGVMQRYYPANGPRKRPTVTSDTPDSLGFFMNPETSTEPNCEGIFLTLTNGRVGKIEYSPD